MSGKPNTLCSEGGDIHTWKATGLDIDAEGVLVTTRHCLRCDAQQDKPYGAGGKRSWREKQQGREETD